MFCTTLLAFLFAYADALPDNLRSLSSNSLSENDKTELLDYHNTLRSNIALGKTNGEPSASNMRTLYWDDTLASAAQSWASQCQYGDMLTNNYGENIAAQSSNSSSLESLSTLESSIQTWFDEHEDYTYSSNACSGECSHYTQVVDAGTYQLGCGYSMCDCSFIIGWSSYSYCIYLVCNYYPGQVVDRPYAPGSAATECPSGTFANTETGLCEQPISCSVCNLTFVHSYYLTDWSDLYHQSWIAIGKAGFAAVIDRHTDGYDVHATYSYESDPTYDYKWIVTVTGTLYSASDTQTIYDYVTSHAYLARCKGLVKNEVGFRISATITDASTSEGGGDNTTAWWVWLLVTLSLVCVIVGVVWGIVVCKRRNKRECQENLIQNDYVAMQDTDGDLNNENETDNYAL